MIYNARKKILLVCIVLLLAAGALFFRYREKSGKTISALPPAKTYETSKNGASSDSSTPVLPSEVNLDIPFTSQAPHQNWDLPYQEFCEEASVLMAASYVKGETIAGPDDADRKMIAIKDFEEKKLGFFKDTTAEETATILKQFYGIEKIEIIFDPSEQSLKKALAQGKAVIVPAAGRELGNPHYKRPGPLYHMLVIKGYTKTGDFITNDPGTRSGANYVYKPSVLLEAIHDWNNGDVYKGKKVAMIVG